MLLMQDQGKLDEAEELLRRALVARETFHGPSHVDTMRCMNNLAGLLEAQGKLEEAEALLRKTAELAASSLGPSHAYTATALSNLGVALRKAGKLDEAEELFKTALEIREKLLGPLALDTAASLSDMTMLMLDQERLTEAEPLFRRILDIRQLVLGPDHRDTAVSLCDLANLLVQMDRPVDAEPLLRRAVTVQVRCLGPGHEDTASATRELAKVLAQQGHVEEAEKLFRRALAVMESVLGPNHPETVITVNHLAVLLKDAGQSAEVEAMFKRVLSLTDTLDLDTTATASPTVRATRRRLRAAAMIAMRGLAELAGAAGRLEEAEVFSCRALVASERALGPVHPVTLTCAEGLAEVLRQLDLLEDAGELYARLVEALAEEYGADSEHVIKYLAFYEEVYAQMRTQKLERERQQQELQREEQQDEDEDEKDGEADDSKDEGDGEDTTEVESAAASSQDAKHVRIAPGARGTDGDGPVSRSAESVGSIMSALFGPLGRSMKKRAMATHRQQSRSAAAATGGDNSDGRQDGNRHAVGGLRHSFASFVSRRGQQQHKHQGSGQQRSTSRAESVVGRVHSSLVAAGRIGSGGPLGDARKSRRAAAYSGHDGNGEPVARADCDQSCVSPGLPLRDLAEDAAAGAAVVSLAAPRTSDTVSSADVSSGGPLKAAAPRGSSGSQVGSEEVYDPMTTPLITASAFGYSSVTAAGGGAGSRSLSRRQPASVVVVAHRRSSVDALDARRSVTNSMISLRRGLSKKALLQQADVDLDDDEDKDEDNDDRFAGDRKSPQDVGQASRRFGITFEVARPGPPPTAISADENDEDTSSVGCCGFGGRKARPVAPR
ncbi:hypothetical protein Vretimale_2968 [Volvox reticuliferus]|uniref:Kinesin light chain n=1 Tax=Volvox reticuliferus TaxID=1737510 RepID=A0A8J4D7H3_9CHLO|nr:hypothetical protein Vretimale_2968 [Volvox reticuliferus]